MRDRRLGNDVIGAYPRADAAGRVSVQVEAAVKAGT